MLWHPRAVTCGASHVPSLTAVGETEVGNAARDDVQSVTNPRSGAILEYVST